MKFLEPMIIAFSMYSKIPMPRIEWNKENMIYTMCFFPLIGVATGAIIYLAGMFLDGNIFSKVHSGRLMFAAVMTLIPVFVSEESIWMDLWIRWTHLDPGEIKKRNWKS